EEEANTSLNKGAWTAHEDGILAQYVAQHGPKRWKSLAIDAGLNRCGKSCRLRWLNYLRPDIKRGNFSDAEDDLILRFHRLLGNRWSLIAKRLPGRTDNEIKNYWNAHLRKKARLMEKLPAISVTAAMELNIWHDESSSIGTEIRDDDESFDFTAQGTSGLDWVKTFLEIEEDA
ncbi:hypothetical protein C2S51_001643, partial [Perilla frutescens var. frutescens]